MIIFRAFALTLAGLIGSVSFAQTASNTMTASIDDEEMVMLMSPDFTRAMSRWSTLEMPEGSPWDFVDEIDVAGYIIDGNAVPMIVRIFFNVWSEGGELRIDQASIELRVQGDTGFWVSMEQEERPTITLTTYDRTDTGVLVETEFSGNSVYWATIYRKPEDRGPGKNVSGNFSIFLPLE
jgi:hypothetical protein